jgi:UDP-N-acetylglucosamine 2-epimerase (non-hydrolysing)
VLVIVWGSRPEAIKLGAVAAALNASHVPFVSLATGQHTTLLAGTPAESDLADSVSLGLKTTGETERWPALAQPVLETALQKSGASLVVVQGDTMSAVVGARAASALGIPVAHVEAGLRSGNLDDPWPEEGYRREITQLATWHFAPTSWASSNLLGEGVSERHVFLTGNPVVSAIARYTDAQPVPIPDSTILFTMHRREWVLSGIQGVLDGLRSWAGEHPDVNMHWPMHPGVAKQLPLGYVENLPPNVDICQPLPYRETIHLLARSLGVCTDSGGLVEEAATLGVPTAVLRHVTDRPEAVEAGVARLSPPTEEGVITALEALREHHLPRRPTDCYGTPFAADHIAAILGRLHSPRAILSIVANAVL